MFKKGEKVIVVDKNRQHYRTVGRIWDSFPCYQTTAYYVIPDGWGSDKMFVEYQENLQAVHDKYRDEYKVRDKAYIDAVVKGLPNSIDPKKGRKLVTAAESSVWDAAWEAARNYYRDDK